jgi:hypothetical protein
VVCQYQLDCAPTVPKCPIAPADGGIPPRVCPGPTRSSSNGADRMPNLGKASYPTVVFRASVMSSIAACSDSLTS